MEQKRLKIALLCDTFYPMIDGVINAVDNYAKNLSKKHDVTVFATKSPDKTYVDNFPYKVVRCKTLPIRLGDYRVPCPQMDGAFKKALKDGRFDIIHLHSPFYVGKAGLKIAKKQHVPAIITLHSQFKQDFMDKTHSKFLTGRLMRVIAKTFNGCQELWTMNPRLEELSREYGYSGKVTILPNGCDLRPQNFDESDLKAFRAKYAKPSEKFLLYVGRIHKLKNIEFILQVCQKLSEKKYPFKMIIVGGGQDFEHFKRRATELNIDGRVIFTGKIADREEIEKFYACSDLFIFPSKYDTDGIVKNEAAAFETPSILLQDCIAASNITDGENGYLEKEDAEAFAQRIVEIFRDEKTYKKVSQNAKKTLFFTWEEIVARAEKEYLRILKEFPKNK